MVDRTVLVRLKSNVGEFVAGMETARAAVRGVTSEIDTSNDRVAWLSQSILALGPALVPLGAAAVPIFSGIATEATVATAAVGVMALAFVGVGAAMKAVNDYQAKPTIENFDKMSLALEKLGPDGSRFVTFLDDLTPRLHSLQLVARHGIFPGAEDGIKSLLTMMPRVQALVSTIASTLGDLMSQAGHGISGDGFKAFFDFLQRDARPILLDMAHAVGNFALGFANMLVGLEPLTMRFSAGLVAMSKSFRDWSAGLGDDSGFQNFMGYVEDSIPKALDFLGALVDAFASIIVAAAPVGNVMLPLLTDLLGLISDFADSPLGPIFLSAAAAMSIYGRAVAIASVTTGGLGKGLAVLGINAAQGSGGIRTLAADVRLMSGEYGRLGKVQSTALSLMSQTTGAAQRASATMRGLGRASVLMAGLALSTSDYGRQMGLASTATYAMMGFLVGGGVGAVAGGVVGATMDFAKASGRAGDAQRQLAADIRNSGNDLAKWSDSITAAKDRSDALAADIGSSNIGEFIANAFDPDAIEAAGQMLLGMQTNLEKMDAATQVAENNFGNLQLAAQLLATTLGIVGHDTEATSAQMTAALTQAQPAMSALGITTQDLMSAVADGSIMTLIGQMTAWQRAADSTAGRTKAVVGAVDDLDNELVSTAGSATQLAQALDGLFSPKMDLAAATNKWKEGLLGLNKELAKGSKSLEGNTKAALMNQDAIRGHVQDLIDVLKAEANAGASSAQLSGSMAKMRKALLNAGDAAHISRKQMNDYIDTLGLTPELVQTLVKNNAPAAKHTLDDYIAALLRADGTSIDNYIRVHTIRTGGDAGLADAHGGAPITPAKQQAGGGLVTGPGGPTDDRINTKLSNREYVVRAAAVAKYGVALFDKYNTMGFANGGLVTYGRSTPPATSGNNSSSPVIYELSVQAAAAGQSLKQLKAALDAAEKAVTKQKDALDNLRSTEKSFGASIADKFAVDLSSGSSSTGGSVASLIQAGLDPATAQAMYASQNPSGLTKIHAAEQDATEMTAIINTLKGWGLSGPQLAQVLLQMSLPDLQALVAAGPGEVRAYQQALGGLYAAQGQVSATAIKADYGAQDAAMVKELREAKAEQKAMNAKLEAMNHHLTALETRSHQEPQETGQAVATVLNRRGADARRRVHAGG